MAEQLPPSIAPLRNVAALISLVQRVQDRDHNLPGMACFYGPSGWGKTSAVTVASNTYNAHAVQVKSVWSPIHFCRAVLTELGVKPARTTPEMVDQIAVQLMRNDRPLLIDDAQYLSTKRMIHLVRDIYESCQTTVILIGEEELPQHLSKFENVHNRMLHWTAAQPCNLEDAVHLSGIYAAGIDIERGLLRQIVEASEGSIRRVAVNLSGAKEIAQSKGQAALTIADWGDRPFNTGQPPAARGPAEMRAMTARPNGPSASLKKVAS